LGSGVDIYSNSFIGLEDPSALMETGKGEVRKMRGEA